MKHDEHNAREPYATIEELAAYLRVPVQTIYRWNSRGTGPRLTKVGRFVRYKWEDVDRWVEDHQPSG